MAGRSRADLAGWFSNQPSCTANTISYTVVLADEEVARIGIIEHHYSSVWRLLHMIGSFQWTAGTGSCNLAVKRSKSAVSFDCSISV